MTKYVDAALDIVRSFLETVKKLDAEAAELSKEYRRERVSGVVYNERLGEIGRRRDRARTDALAELADLRKRYRDAALLADRVDGSMLDAADVELLRLGVELTRNQFDALAEKHNANVLMAGVLRQYAEKRPDAGFDVSGLPVPAAARIEAFEQFAGSCAGAIENPNGLQGALLLSGQGTPSCCVESF